MFICCYLSLVSLMHPTNVPSPTPVGVTKQRLRNGIAQGLQYMAQIPGQATDCPRLTRSKFSRLLFLPASGRHGVEGAPLLVLPRERIAKARQGKAKQGHAWVLTYTPSTSDGRWRSSRIKPSKHEKL